MREVIPDFRSGDIPCRECRKPVTLWFNGGELDRQECCGITYYTQATGYELVIDSPEAEAGRKALGEYAPQRAAAVVIEGYRVETCPVRRA